jgi:GNAT superfamily N-acetyltransferase
MGRREAREVARLRVRMLEELGEMGGEDPRTLVGATEAFLQRRIGSGGHFTSVDEEEGRLVGIASLEVFERLPYPGNLSGREGYVLNVYVEPASRRRGLAGALVRDLVGVARKEDVGRLWLHASAYGRGVYEAAGFEARTLEEMELLLTG